MKKQVLLIVVLIALIGTGTAFAQQATLDKLAFHPNPRNNPTEYVVDAANKQVSGQVVIPGAYEGKPVAVWDAGNRGGGFRECAITSVVMLNGVTRIGRSAFQDCTELTSVTIPNSVTTIGGGAFFGCTRLTSITIPASVTSIGGVAFQNCTSLASITIPASVTEIGGTAFAGCTNLTSFTIQGMVGSIHGTAFPGDLRAKYLAASGGPGTYTRQRGSDVWTKQGAVSSIDGTWRKSDGTQLVITNSAGKDNSFATLSADGRTLTIGGTTFTKQ